MSAVKDFLCFRHSRSISSTDTAFLPHPIFFALSRDVLDQCRIKGDARSAAAATEPAISGQQFVESGKIIRAVRNSNS